MRSAADVVSALLAAVLVAVAVVIATGVGLPLAPAHPEASPVAHTLDAGAHQHHPDH